MLPWTDDTCCFNGGDTLRLTRKRLCLQVTLERKFDNIIDQDKRCPYASWSGNKVDFVGRLYQID